MAFRGDFAQEYTTDRLSDYQVMMSNGRAPSYFERFTFSNVVGSNGIIACCFVEAKICTKSMDKYGDMKGLHRYRCKNCEYTNS